MKPVILAEDHPAIGAIFPHEQGSSGRRVNWVGCHTPVMVSALCSIASDRSLGPLRSWKFRLSFPVGGEPSRAWDGCQGFSRTTVLECYLNDFGSVQLYTVPSAKVISPDP